MHRTPEADAQPLTTTNEPIRRTREQCAEIQHSTITNDPESHPLRRLSGLDPNRRNAYDRHLQPDPSDRVPGAR